MALKWNSYWYHGLKWFVALASLSYFSYELFHISWDQFNLSPFFNASSLIYVLLCLLLMPLNYLFESVKWQLLLSQNIRLSLKESVQAVLAGVAATSFMPAKTGEYLGRMLFLSPQHRIPSIPAGIVGGLGQLGATLILGLLGWNLISNPPQVAYSEWYGWTMLFFVIACGVIFITLFPKIIQKVNTKHALDFVHQYKSVLLIKVLWYSFVRFFIFTIQYVLLIAASGISPFSFELIPIVMAIFLIQTILPVPTIADMGVRLWAAQLFIVNQPNLFIPVTLLWMINVALPSIIGILNTLRIKRKM